MRTYLDSRNREVLSEMTFELRMRGTEATQSKTMGNKVPEDEQALQSVPRQEKRLVYI